MNPTRRPRPESRRLVEDDETPLSRRLPRTMSNPAKDNFPHDTVPAEIEALVASGELVDRSWHQEPGPSFSVAAKWDRTPACPSLMVNPEDPAQREDPDSPRYSVGNEDGVALWTDDVNAAIAKLREVSAAYTPTAGNDSDVVESLISGASARSVFEGDADREPHRGGGGDDPDPELVAHIAQNTRMQDEDAFAEAVNAKLAARGIRGSWEYPGWIDVTNNHTRQGSDKHSGYGLAVGTANGYWGFNPYTPDGSATIDGFDFSAPTYALWQAIEDKGDDATPDEVAAAIVVTFNELKDAIKDIPGLIFDER